MSLYTVALYVCCQVGLKEVEDILRDVDLNGDGLVDFEGKNVDENISVLMFCGCSAIPVIPLHRVCPNDVSLTSDRR